MQPDMFDMLLDDVQRTDVSELPRDLILASAGSGKTFRISSAIIALLARGESPDEILASTFTRKAAGEILDRVLIRLARASLDDADAAELAVHAAPSKGDPACNRAFWNGILERLVRELHRVNIGTLDAFFLRTAMSFGNELGLPATWTISDETTGDHIRSLALQDVLQTTSQQEFLTLVRGIARNAGTRSVHDQLLRKVRLLTAVHHALDSGVDGHWKAFDELAAQRPADTNGRGLALALRMEAIDPPRTKAGPPNKNWADNFEKLADAFRGCKWDELTSNTLAKAARAEIPFSRIDVPADVRAIVNDAWALARLDVAYRMSRRSHALGKFAVLYAAALDRRRAQQGVYEFDDVTRFLGGPDPVGHRDDIYYRLDARAKHILLDEFQDTSVPQWEALAPIATELLSGHLGERAAVIVADPKQSIYGWRGGSPDLVKDLESVYHLRREQLATSYRSSKIVLDFVNELYGRFNEPATWFDDPEYAPVARKWVEDFSTHVPAKDLPGHVLLRTGPVDEESGEARPRLVKYAAEQVATLHRAMPGFTIGVLTRTNGTVARMMMNLKALGVRASEEGGNPLTDAAPVTSVLALLRLCDHPANAVARYHIAKTPLGSVVGFTDHTDSTAAAAVSFAYRKSLLEKGYGPTIAAVAEKLMPSCDAREKRRLGQLVEIAFRFEKSATLRPNAFVSYVQRERVEDPVAADVRVMTIHQSKGLEFDIVVLPELDAPFVQRRNSEVMSFRPSAGARITRAFPFVSKGEQELFGADDIPELADAAAQAFEGELRDGLSTMYVALTRAKHALHIIVKPDKAGSRWKTGARVLRQAFIGDVEAPRMTTLKEFGDPSWAQTLVPPEGARVAHVSAETLNLKNAAVRNRALTRRSPSQLEGGGRTDLGMVLRLSGNVATRRGSIVHLWLEQIEWLQDSSVNQIDVASLAHTVAPEMAQEEIDALRGELVAWLSHAAIARVLRRQSWAGDTTVAVEVPFMIREDNTLIEGFIDRLVLTRTDGVVTSAAVIDFKTDNVEAGDGKLIRTRTDHYRPQIAAYQRAVAAMYGLSIDAVSGFLVFLQAGEVVSC
jgi:ATP-dependent exoDNAse (exonuclease V) beta subunit